MEKNINIVLIKLTACPRSDSTLKLLVRAGNIIKATTVMSGFDCFR